jgi:Protein of unknown function (DUF1501)
LAWPTSSGSRPAPRRTIRPRTEKPSPRVRSRDCQGSAGQERLTDLPSGRAEPHRPLGPQARRSREYPQPLQADPDKDTGPPLRRTYAEARNRDRPGHVDPLAQLHARRPFQPHGRDAPDAHRLDAEEPRLRDAYGRHTFGQSVLLARRLIEAGTRFVQVNWPSVANGDRNSTAWDTHAANFNPLKNLYCPKLDAALSSLIADLDARGLLDETLVLAIGEFGRSPRMGVSTSGNNNAPDGRDHWPYCYTAMIAGAGIKRGAVHGKSDEQASSPIESPVHPTELLANIYHSLGINPATMAMNHLNQPRELVKAEPVYGLYG